MYGRDVPLRGPRFSGDPVLEECLAGRHRMLASEDGLPVKRVQAALIELDFPVGPRGTDGVFGGDTGAAVTRYKTHKGLVPNDPVVGPGTSKALDDDLFVDPPTLDPAFAEFSAFVVAHRLEPFAALELRAMIGAPLDSWRHMIGRFALVSLSSARLLGIVAQSRAVGLRDAFLAAADPTQLGGVTADELFDDAIIGGDALASTVTFQAGGEPRSFVVIRDDVILGRAVVVRSTDGTRAPATLQGVLVHELTHVRNRANSQALVATSDDDIDVYADTALARARSAASGRTSDVLDSFVAEMVARHVHWIIQKEEAGTPGNLAILALQADQLVGAVTFYFVEVGAIYDSNGYGAAISAQGDAVRLRQLELWLRICARQSFSDDPAQDEQSTLVFEAAAQHCADLIANPSFELPVDDGLVPLPADFS